MGGHTNNVLTGEDPMDLPTLNWRQVAAEQRRRERRR
jgi:hypothetical protein